MRGCNKQGKAADFLTRTGLVLLAIGMAACGREAPSGPSWDFVRLDANGDEIAADVAPQHSCVRDARYGLVWEVKQLEPGPRHRDDLFTWYSEDDAANGGERGLADGGNCGLPRCNTAALVAAVNSAGLCGLDDWRMPSRDELLTLVDATRIGQGPAMDPEYFPGAAPAEYWTGTTFSLYPQGAWAIDTIYAQDRVDWKTEAKRVRLVSGSRTAVRPKGRGR